MDGQYGGLNGVGGFDADSPSLTLFNPTISDVRGDILGYYDSFAGSVTWNTARPTGYGAPPNYRPLALGSGVNLAQSSAWRGHWVDITGYYNIGLRSYDPVSGRWLTYDSAWNARDPNYYTFAGGDPINYFDSDGRIANSFYEDSSVLAYQGNGNYANLDFGTMVYGFGISDPGDQAHAEFLGLLQALYPNEDFESFEDESSSGGGLELAQAQSLMGFLLGVNSSITPEQQDNSSGFSVGNALLNTDARNAAWNVLSHPDFSSGWGVAQYADAGVSYAANTADAAANLIPVIGTGKALVEDAAKTGIKAITDALAKNAAGSGADVALGKGSADLLGFADEIGAHSYHTWYDAGLVSEPIGEANFAVPFNEATSAAGNIRFNLDGVDIEAALNMDPSLAAASNPILDPSIGGQGQITEWELRQVLSDKNLFNKTTFHWGGNVEFTPEEAASMGVRFIGK